VPGVGLLLLLLLAAAMLARTALHAPRAVEVRAAPALELDPRRVTQRLARAVRVPSVVTTEPDALERGRMARMADLVEESFPPLVAGLDYERHEHCLVFRWRGSAPELAPILLLAHLDVVPVDPATEADWSFPPFGGDVAAGFVWGRGTLDDKGSAFAILEALEHLVTRGVQPRRGVIVALGLDEEIGGTAGARAQAARFAQEGLEPYLILDEGYAVLEGIVDVVPHPVAVVGVAEKGSLTVELRVEAEGGHSSMPEEQTSLGILASAIAALEAAPQPARLDGAPAYFLDELAREMNFGQRFLFANRWLTEPLLRKVLLEEPGTAALLRTTTAVTRAEAGVAANVLPRSARATVNLRIHSRDSVDVVLERVRRTIDDPRVELEVVGESFEPSPVSPHDGPAWEHLEATIRACYPGVVVAPSLVVGATDARHYAGLTSSVYRFNGLRLGPDDLPRIHGVDERISVENYMEMIRFYARLIEGA